MAHNIDTMMYVGNTPWHGKGTPLQSPPTINEALELSGLNWNVYKKQTYYYKNNAEATPTGHYVTTRDDTEAVLGNVSKRYTILQNKEAFQPFEPMLDMGFKLETAGSILGGKMVWILAKSPEKYLVGDDGIQRYVFMYTSHDGSAGNCFRDTGIRIVCNNTLNFALNNTGTFNYQIKHTASIKDKVKQLKDNIVNSNDNFKQAIDTMNRFKEQSFNEKQAGVYFEAVIPFLIKENREKISKAELGIHTRNTALPVWNKLHSLFKNGKGNQGKTLWDAYNAITEYYDHETTPKDWVKYNQFGQGFTYKTRAFDYANRVVKHSAQNKIAKHQMRFN